MAGILFVFVMIGHVWSADIMDTRDITRICELRPNRMSDLMDDLGMHMYLFLLFCCMEIWCNIIIEMMELLDILKGYKVRFDDISGIEYEKTQFELEAEKLIERPSGPFLIAAKIKEDNPEYSALMFGNLAKKLSRELKNDDNKQGQGIVRMKSNLLYSDMMESTQFKESPKIIKVIIMDKFIPLLDDSTKLIRDIPLLANEILLGTQKNDDILLFVKFLVETRINKELKQELFLNFIHKLYTHCLTSKFIIDDYVYHAVFTLYKEFSISSMKITDMTPIINLFKRYIETPGTIHPTMLYEMVSTFAHYKLSFETGYLDRIQEIFCDEPMELSLWNSLVETASNEYYNFGIEFHDNLMEDQLVQYMRLMNQFDKYIDNNGVWNNNHMFIKAITKITATQSYHVGCMFMEYIRSSLFRKKVYPKVEFLEPITELHKMIISDTDFINKVEPKTYKRNYLNTVLGIYYYYHYSGIGKPFVEEQMRDILHNHIQRIDTVTINILIKLFRHPFYHWNNMKKQDIQRATNAAEFDKYRMFNILKNVLNDANDLGALDQDTYGEIFLILVRKNLDDEDDEYFNAYLTSFAMRYFKEYRDNLDWNVINAMILAYHHNEQTFSVYQWNLYKIVRSNLKKSQQFQ